ncbi:MAG: hypothetical protein GY792_11990 [Gammaproteobacteria bacterium]|nr:hypothetical protein [Gammaproteobacteria bacterium]
MTSDDLIEMNRRVVFALWNVASPTGIPKALSPRLIFPELRTGDIRISEQEARLLWCTMLQDTSYYYAVEAPTVETYIQSGTRPISARTDLALYQLLDSGLQRVANIEFKAHNATPEQIMKDIEKLIREKITGNWFHLLSAANAATIPRLFEKFVAAFTACSSLVSHDIDIVFCICVLHNRKMLARRFTFNQDQGDFVEHVSDFFSKPDAWVATFPEISG